MASALSHWAISPTPLAASFGHCFVGRVEREKGSSLSSARSLQVEEQGAASDSREDSRIREKSRDPAGFHPALSWRRGGLVDPRAGVPTVLAAVHVRHLLA